MCHDRLVLTAHGLRDSLTIWIILINAYKIKVVLTIWGLTYFSFLGCKKIFTSCNEIPFIIWIVRILLYHYSYVFHNDVLFHFIKTKLIKKMSKFKQLCFSCRFRKWTCMYKYTCTYMYIQTCINRYLIFDRPVYCIYNCKRGPALPLPYLWALGCTLHAHWKFVSSKRCTHRFFWSSL